MWACFSSRQVQEHSAGQLAALAVHAVDLVEGAELDVATLTVDKVVTDDAGKSLLSRCTIMVDSHEAESQEENSENASPLFGACVVWLDHRVLCACMYCTYVHVCVYGSITLLSLCQSSPCNSNRDRATSVRSRVLASGCIAPTLVLPLHPS